MVIVQSIHQKAWHNTLKVVQNSSLKDDELETEKFGVRLLEQGVSQLFGLNRFELFS